MRIKHFLFVFPLATCLISENLAFGQEVQRDFYLSYHPTIDLREFRDLPQRSVSLSDDSRITDAIARSKDLCEAYRFSSKLLEDSTPPSLEITLRWGEPQHERNAGPRPVVGAILRLIPMLVRQGRDESLACWHGANPSEVGLNPNPSEIELPTCSALCGMSDHNQDGQSIKNI